MARVGFASWGLLALTFALGGCHGAASSGAHGPPDAKTQPLPPQPSVVLQVPPGQPVSFESELQAVAALRGLEPLGPIQGLRVSEQAMLDHVRRSVGLERPTEALQGTEAMLVGLGVVPAHFNLEATLFSLLSSSLAGLYEPRLKMMLVRDHLQPMEAKVTLLHELVHALQDQHFDLSEVVNFRQDDSDVSSAISSLAEGDATSAMLDGVLPDGQTALLIPEEQIEAQFFAHEPASDSPPVITRSLYAPYIDGIRFVHALRRRGGWKEVDKAWANAPQSTEQILHLEKFDARETPLIVEVPQPPSADWRLVFHDVWGEQSLRILLEEWLSKQEATLAATGWGGDRIATFARQDALLVAWDLRMDTHKDAEELESALRKALSHPDSEADSAPSSDPHPTPNAEDRADALSICGTPPGSAVRFAVARTGPTVFVRGAPFTRSSQTAADCSLAQDWLQARSPKSASGP